MLRMKNWYFWGSMKNPTFREGSQKTIIEGGLLKKGAWAVCRFKWGGGGGGAGEEGGGGVFGGGGLMTPMHTICLKLAE